MFTLRYIHTHIYTCNHVAHLLNVGQVSSYVFVFIHCIYTMYICPYYMYNTIHINIYYIYIYIRIYFENNVFNNLQVFNNKLYPFIEFIYL